MNKLYAFWDSLTTAFFNNKAKRKDDHILIKTVTQAENIQINKITLMVLCADCKNLPQMILIDESQEGFTTYHFPLYAGYQVHTCNEFLRSLDTDLDIQFVAYKQYAELIESCFEAVSK